MTASVHLWSTTAASNSGLDTGANFPEGMAPSAVNDSARGTQAAIKRMYNELAGGIAAGGTGDALTLTTPSTLVSGDLANGLRLSFRATATNTVTNPTIAVDGLTAKTIYKGAGSALAAGDITSGGVYDLCYSSVAGGFILLNPTTSVAAAFASGTLMLFQQTAAPTGWTKQTTHNDKALRVVSGTASSGGTSAFSTVFGKTATDAYTLLAADIPSHTHTQNSHNHTQDAHTHNVNIPGGGGSSATVTAGATGNFTATAAASSTTATNQAATATNQNTGGGGSHSHAMDIRVQYVDLIIASKD